MGVEVEPQVELRPVAADVAEVGFEFGATEGVDDLPGKGGKVLSLLANAEACELVGEGGAGETSDGAAVDLFCWAAKLFSLQEVC